MCRSNSSWTIDELYPVDVLVPLRQHLRPDGMRRADNTYLQLPFIPGVAGRKITAPSQLFLGEGARWGICPAEFRSDPLRPGLGVLQLSQFGHRARRKDHPAFVGIFGYLEEPRLQFDF